MNRLFTAGLATTLSFGLALPAFAISPNASSVAQAKVEQHMRMGARGNSVEVLQAILAADDTVYPEGLVTGYYGPLTTKAVRNFQKKHGISPLGIVGPMTMKKLNEIATANGLSVETSNSSMMGTSTPRGGMMTKPTPPGQARKLCANVPPGHLIAPGWLKKNNGVVPVIPPCQILPPGISNQINGTPTTTPDTTKPVISGIGATVTTTGATITWATNEAADTQVKYGTTTAYGSMSTLNTSLVTAHSVVLSGLDASKLYHYVVMSKDAAGNMATSSDYTFTTATPDTSRPTLSGVNVSVGGSTAGLTWTTNESSTSKAYYGTTTPLSLTSTHTGTLENTNLVTSHALNLTGLSTSTTYYFVLESKDASNNTGTSTQSMFTTNAN